MTFLKKLGMWIVKGVAIANGAYPFVPEQYRDEVKLATDKLAQVAGVIVQVEAFGQALGIAGPEKLKAAAPAVAQIILQSSLVAGRKINDPVLFQAGAEKVAAGMADILNSLHEDEAQQA